MTIEERYRGCQSTLKEGCYILSLCSIIEEYTRKPVDVLEVIAVAKNRRWITEDGFVYTPCKILQYFTLTKWNLTTVTQLPDVISRNMFTVEKWRNGKITHFRRRYVDTLYNSLTVAEGYLEAYYLFEAED